MPNETRPPHDYSRPFQGFQDLMSRRVHDILLVSSLYDSFILSEDGKLHDLILDEFVDLNLRHTPGLMHVSSGREALELAKREDGRYNLIIASMHLGDMSVLELARQVKASGLDTPVVVLAYDNRELTDFVADHDISDIERAFLWQGDVAILVAVVKYVEDKWNVAHDSGVVGVQSIIVVEDNIRFYSSYLPVIYTELMKQSHNLIPEGINLADKLMRLRARPKILLCDNYEEAWRYFETYEEAILGVVSDIEFPRGGELDRGAGLELARRVREKRSDIPVMLQSSFPKNEDLAREIGASFLLKGSPVLLHQLRKFMVENFSFGDFVFHTPDGSEVGRAHNLRTLAEMIRTVPGECLAYHGARNHFSNWLKARAEFAVAQRLRPRALSEYESIEDVRHDLVQAIAEYRRERMRGQVADFDRDNFDASASFSRIGGGSLGGKARGLAFVNRLIAGNRVENMFPGVAISVPPSVVLGTDVFDRFLEENELRDFAINCDDDETIRRRFLSAPFPDGERQDLASFLDLIHYPLAVRSSSLLEDSQYQPFAGIYETYMLPNNHRDPEVRLHQLIDTISRVYSSTFSQHAKAYLRGTPYRLEEEKMAVIVQKVVGAVHGDRFYPDFGGVARSHNFYPTPPMTAEDGVAAVALGLGAMVCEGGVCVRFCPKFPRHLVQFSSVKDVLQNSQREFYSIELGNGSSDPFATDEIELKLHGLEVAEADGTLTSLGSTYSPENDAIYDGLSRPGVRLVNFAPILKHGIFPLAEILDFLLDIGVQGTRCPVELEFAVNLDTPQGEPKEFGFLQMRPLPLSDEVEGVEVGDVDRAKVICESPSVLGNGKIADVKDLVVVDFHRFERHKSRDVAMTVAQMNGRLVDEGLPYVLIGVGRWGSTEPYLGIPVTWDQIAGVRVIVEAGFKDFTVTPSQGTHFFQNLTSCSVGYFTINPEVGQGFVDWDWLHDQKALTENGCVRHLRFERPLMVLMDGKNNRGVILKPSTTD